MLPVEHRKKCVQEINNMDARCLRYPHCLRFTLLGALLLALGGLTPPASAGGDGVAKGHTFAVRFIGTATTPALDWARWPAVLQDQLPADAVCFKVPMFDVTASTRRGTGINCLSDQQDFGGAITVQNTVFFKTPRGVVVSQGRITAQPVVLPRDSGGIYGGMSHLIGALPAERNVVRTTKGYKRWTGKTRCSGFIDLDQLASGKIRMDSVYLVELTKKRARNSDES